MRINCRALTAMICLSALVLLASCKLKNQPVHLEKEEAEYENPAEALEWEFKMLKNKLQKKN